MFDFDLGSILSILGGFAGVAAIIELIANIAQVLDWIKGIIDRILQRDKTDSSKSQSSGSSQIPNNLPSSIPLIGRKDLLQQLCDSIDKNTLTMILGTGGIGKSTLAIEAAKRYYLTKKKRHFHFDAIIWISAKNDNISYSDFLDTAARVLEYTGILQITDIEQKAAEVEQLFQKKHILLIVDNYETISDHRISDFIQRVCDHDRVVITTRENKDWDIAFKVIPVDKLEAREGIALIKSEYQKRNLNFKEVSPEAVNLILKVTDGSPLAIKWAIGQIATTKLPLERVIALLENGKGDIFEKMFSTSWNSLDENCCKLLYILLFFSPSASRDALFWSSGLDEADFDVSLGKLNALSLLEVTGANDLNQHYALHALTRSFVAAKLALSQIEDICLYEGVLDYYRVFCKEKGIEGTQKAYDALEAELTNILKIVEWASGRNGNYESALLEIIGGISVFLWSRGYWTHRINMSKLAVELALKLGDYRQAVLHHYYWGIVQFWQGNRNGTNNCIQACEKYLENIQDNTCAALVLRLKALMNMDNYEQSVADFTTVLQVLDRSASDDIRLFADWRSQSEEGYKSGIVAIYQEIGITYNRNKKYDEAIIWLNKSLTLAEAIGDIEGQSVSLSHLGFSYIGLSDYAKARSLCKKGLELALIVNRKSTIGRCYQALAISESARKRNHQASKYASKAGLMFNKLGMISEAADVRKYIL